MRIWKLKYANDNQALIPSLWAQESLAILEENMVSANMVYRDFSNVIANFGDTVNTRKPAEFKGKRKSGDDPVTIQNAVSTNIPVKLDQHIHTSFMIKDGEESRAFKDLVNYYLRPAMIAQARVLDQIVLAQAIRFLPNFAGRLGTQLTESSLIDLRKQFNDNKAPFDGRNLVVSSSSESDLLKISNFITAQTVGDNGTAMREASLGRKYGFNIFMDQNTPYVPAYAAGTFKAGAINLTAGYAAGATALTVNGFSAAITAGTYVTIAGDDTPQRVASTTGGSTPTVITLQAPGLKRAVVNTAVVTSITSGVINQSASLTYKNVTVSNGYPNGYDKELTITYTGLLSNGTPIAFGTASDVYCVIDTSVSGGNTIGITLDRPLVVSVADTTAVCPGPAGAYNFGFQTNALALVIRPLSLPKVGTNAIADVATYNNLSMRAVITYDGLNQGHLVTLDMLAGIAQLESKIGVPLFG